MQDTISFRVTVTKNACDLCVREGDKIIIRPGKAHGPCVWDGRDCLDPFALVTHYYSRPGRRT